MTSVAEESVHYIPPWYPNQDPHHNPWSVPDSMTGKTHYATWVDSLPEGELLRLIAEYHASEH